MNRTARTAPSALAAALAPSLAAREAALWAAEPTPAAPAAPAAPADVKGVTDAQRRALFAPAWQAALSTPPAIAAERLRRIASIVGAGLPREERAALQAAEHAAVLAETFGEHARWLARGEAQFALAMALAIASRPADPLASEARVERVYRSPVGLPDMQHRALGDLWARYRVASSEVRDQARSLQEAVGAVHRAALHNAGSVHPLTPACAAARDLEVAQGLDALREARNELRAAVETLTAAAATFAEAWGAPMPTAYEVGAAREALIAARPPARKP